MHNFRTGDISQHSWSLKKGQKRVGSRYNWLGRDSWDALALSSGGSSHLLGVLTTYLMSVSWADII